MNYIEMKPHDIDRVLATRPIAIIPWGSHEWHGKHCAIGLDTLKCYGQALAICRETGGVVLPPVYCGFQTMKPHAGFKHTLEFRRETVKDLARQYLEQLRDEGFKVICIIMGHYGHKHVRAIKEVRQDFIEDYPDVRVWAFTDYEPTMDEGFGGDHAGVNETSLLMYLRPELVDLSLLPQGDDIDWRAEGIGTGSADVRKEASPERGKQILDILVRNASQRINALLGELT
jgi:creatinine amidohydrolase